MSERVFIVGAGRVGQGLARAFRIAGVDIVGVHGKRGAPGATSHGPLPGDIARANTIILAVRDDQIEAALDQVLGAAPQGSPTMSGTRRLENPDQATAYRIIGKLVEQSVLIH